MPFGCRWSERAHHPEEYTTPPYYIWAPSGLCVVLHVGKVTWKVWTGGVEWPWWPPFQASGGVAYRRGLVGCGTGLGRDGDWDGDAGIGNGWGLGMGLGMRV